MTLEGLPSPQLWARLPHHLMDEDLDEPGDPSDAGNLRQWSGQKPLPQVNLQTISTEGRVVVGEQTVRPCLQMYTPAKAGGLQD